MDLVLRARSLQNQARTRLRSIEAIDLYERALQLDPTSIPVMMGLAGALLARSGFLGEELAGDTLDRVTNLVSSAAAFDPSHPSVLWATSLLLTTQERWLDAVPVLQRLIEIYPNHAGGHSQLAFCKIRTGRASDAIDLLERSLLLDPRSPLAYNVYGFIGFALLLMGDDKGAIVWNERCLMANPETSDYQRAWRYSQLACAHARSGNIRAAHLALAEANRLAPHDTVRSHYPEVLDPAYMAQIERFREGLRSAGLRDHAEEDADFGIKPDNQLRLDLRGYTPTNAPGVQTIRTADLVAMLAQLIGCCRYRLTFLEAISPRCCRIVASRREFLGHDAGPTEEKDGGAN
jgi:adenylate cyclase